MLALINGGSVLLYINLSQFLSIFKYWCKNNKTLRLIYIPSVLLVEEFTSLLDCTKWTSKIGVYPQYAKIIFGA
jgi:hypothetical protein